MSRTFSVGATASIPRPNLTQPGMQHLSSQCSASDTVAQSVTEFCCRYFGDIPVGFRGVGDSLGASNPLMANRVFDEATLLQAAAILQQQQYQQQQQQQNLVAQATLLAMQQSSSSDSLARAASQV